MKNIEPFGFVAEVSEPPFYRILQGKGTIGGTE